MGTGRRRDGERERSSERNKQDERSEGLILVNNAHAEEISIRTEEEKKRKKAEAVFMISLAPRVDKRLSSNGAVTTSWTYFKANILGQSRCQDSNDTTH